MSEVVVALTRTVLLDGAFVVKGRRTFGPVQSVVQVKLWSYSPFSRHTLLRQLDGLVKEERLADVLYLGNRAFQVERFRQDNLEDLRGSAWPLKIQRNRIPSAR